MKGRSKKFQYILGDGSIKVCDIEGDEFSENDYGIVVDNSTESQTLKENLSQLAHAALQNQALSFSSIMKIYSSPSLSEVQRIIEKDEKDRQQSAAKENEDKNKLQMQTIEYQKMMEQQRLDLENQMNQRDNETKILIEEIKAGSEDASQTREDLMEKIKQFDEKMQLQREQFEHQKDVDKKSLELKEKSINKKTTK